MNRGARVDEWRDGRRVSKGRARGERDIGGKAGGELGREEIYEGGGGGGREESDSNKYNVNRKTWLSPGNSGSMN